MRKLLPPTLYNRDAPAAPANAIAKAAVTIMRAMHRQRHPAIPNWNTRFTRHVGDVHFAILFGLRQAELKAGIFRSCPRRCQEARAAGNLRAA